jgi:DNA-binding NarL/FixJ family response regulator
MDATGIEGTRQAAVEILPFYLPQTARFSRVRDICSITFPGDCQTGADGDRCYTSTGLPTKVLIADDHRLTIEGTKNALEAAGDFTVVGEATNGAQVLPLVRRLRPELVLLDLRMPQMDGLTCLTKIRKEFPETKVAILSANQDPATIQTALRRGASAFIVKTVNPEDLASALRQTMDGTVFTTAGVSDDPGERAAKEAGLTERELVIVRAVARGLSNEAIAKELWVAEQTVKFHLTNIYRKLDVSNRTEAARYAFEQGLVEHDAPAG